MHTRRSFSSESPLYTLRKQIADDFNSTRLQYRRKSLQKLNAKNQYTPNLLLISGVFQASQNIFRNSLAFKNPELASVHRYKQRLHHLLKKSIKQKELNNSKYKEMPSVLTNYQYIRSKYLKK